MKVWVTPPGQESQAAKVFAEGKGNMGWAAISVSCDHMTRYKIRIIIVIFLPYFIINVFVYIFINQISLFSSISIPL